MEGAKLFESLGRGDSAAFEEVCRRYGDRVARIAHWRLGGLVRRWLETADVVQTAFGELIRARGAVRFASEGAFLRWITVIVERTIVRTARRLSAARRDVNREVPLSDGDAPTALRQVETPSRIAERGETRARLARAVAALPRNDRKVVIARLVLELPWPAVAESLRTTVPAAQMRLQRARRRLRAVLSFSA